MFTVRVYFLSGIALRRRFLNRDLAGRYLRNMRKKNAVSRVFLSYFVQQECL